MKKRMILKVIAKNSEDQKIFDNLMNPFATTLEGVKKNPEKVSINYLTIFGRKGIGLFKTLKIYKQLPDNKYFKKFEIREVDDLGRVITSGRYPWKNK